MENSIIKIRQIELINFKNVEHGTIKFQRDIKNNAEYNSEAEIIGIYGQNGSGKTALVNACYFVKCSLEGRELPKDAYNYINLFEKFAEIKIDFYIDTHEEQFFVYYEIMLEKLEDKKVRIVKEKLSYSKGNKYEWTTKTPMLEYNLNNEEEILIPKYKSREIISEDKNNEVNLKVAKVLSIEKNLSFIFNEKAKSIFLKSLKNEDDKKILNILTYFARFDFFVVKNDYSGIINMNWLMPFIFRIEEESEEKSVVTSGDIGIELTEPTIIDKQNFNMISKIIEQMNIVLNRMVPNLKIELYNYGEQYDKEGNLGIKAELVSLKQDAKLPVQYESEGIKKIISILSALIAMYNNPSVAMIVDELDSGIFEFLLGELLKVIEQGGKGQLIFTSHNLRPLEILDDSLLYFTTTNPKNRYIKFSYVKKNNNLRSLYLRSINLGGQKEELYNKTNELEISRAFRLAGENHNGI